MPFADFAKFEANPQVREFRQPADRAAICAATSKPRSTRSLSSRQNAGSPLPSGAVGDAKRMRWFWIDRFAEFERGQRAVAIKNVATGRRAFDDHFPGFPIMPHSLIIEGMAQTAGLLVGEIDGFSSAWCWPRSARRCSIRSPSAGDTLRYTATVARRHKRRRACSVTSHVGDELQAEVEMMFAFLDDRFPERSAVRAGRFPGHAAAASACTTWAARPMASRSRSRRSTPRPNARPRPATSRSPATVAAPRAGDSPLSQIAPAAVPHARGTLGNWRNRESDPKRLITMRRRVVVTGIGLRQRRWGTKSRRCGRA